MDIHSQVFIGRSTPTNASPSSVGSKSMVGSKCIPTLSSKRCYQSTLMISTDLKPVATPTLDDANISDADCDAKGQLNAVAARICATPTGPHCVGAVFDNLHFVLSLLRQPPLSREALAAGPNDIASCLFLNKQKATNTQHRRTTARRRHTSADAKTAKSKEVLAAGLGGLREELVVHALLEPRGGGRACEDRQSSLA